MEIMATNSNEQEAVFCLGCRVDLCERAGDREVLMSPATQKILPVWRDIISQHLEATGKNINIRNFASQGMCRKCVHAYERFQCEKVTLSEGNKSAIAHIIMSAPQILLHFQLVHHHLLALIEVLLEAMSVHLHQRELHLIHLVQPTLLQLW